MVVTKEKEGKRLVAKKKQNGTSSGKAAALSHWSILHGTPGEYIPVVILCSELRQLRLKEAKCFIQEHSRNKEKNPQCTLLRIVHIDGQKCSRYLRWHC
ncbi:uncharacterized protein LOC143665414 isoform X2 [Tamandua tetradactyla]|uniref:uncharacterized protein LOC143665414 isoform X2 n=1 Tax=Tamandua tetradactyla TaxID=48850 RepID=UPI004053E999